MGGGWGNTRVCIAAPPQAKPPPLSSARRHHPACRQSMPARAQGAARAEHASTCAGRFKGTWRAVVSGRARKLRDAQVRPDRAWLRLPHRCSSASGPSCGLNAARISCRMHRARRSGCSLGRCCVAVCALQQAAPTPCAPGVGGESDAAASQQRARPPPPQGAHRPHGLGLQRRLTPLVVVLRRRRTWAEWGCRQGAECWGRSRGGQRQPKLQSWPEDGNRGARCVMLAAPAARQSLQVRH